MADDGLNLTFKDYLQVELENSRELGDFNSSHEAYAIILANLEEYWDEVKTQHKDRNYGVMLERLVQISAASWKAAESLNLIPVARLTDSDDDDRIKEIEELMNSLLGYCEDNGQFGEPAQKDGPKPYIVQFEPGQLREYRDNIER